MSDAVPFTFVPALMIPPRGSGLRRSRSTSFSNAASSFSRGGNGSGQLHRAITHALHVISAGQSFKPTSSPRARGKVQNDVRLHDRRYVEGEARFRQLLGTGNWQSVARVLEGLKDEQCELNLRTWRSLMAVLAESGRGAEALMYLHDMKEAGVVADGVTLKHAATACAGGGDVDSALGILRTMNERRLRSVGAYNSVLLAIVNGKMRRQAGSGGRRESNHVEDGEEDRNERREHGNGVVRPRRGALSTDECDRAVALVDDMREAGAPPTVLTYNVLIAALARSRRPSREVLGLMAQMRLEGLAPDQYTFVGALMALGNKYRGFERSVALLEDAKKCLKGAALTPVYAAVMKNCGAEARWEKAAELLEEMRVVGVPRDQFTYCCVLNACKEAGKWEKALEFLGDMRREEGGGVEPNLVAYNTCIGACAFFGRPGSPSSSPPSPLQKPPKGGETPRNRREESPREKLTEEQAEMVRAGDAALRLMDEMGEVGISPDVVTYGALMSALGPRGVSGADKVLDLFDALGKDGGITPNTVAYICVIRAWGDKGDWRRAEEMLEQMQHVHRLAPNRHCFSAVIKALANGGQWERALQRLDEMRGLAMAPDHIVYASAIGACEKFGRWEEALNTLTKMVDDKTPRKALTWAYNSVVSALGKARQLGAAKDLVKGMKSYGIMPDQYTYASLIRGAGLMGSWKECLAMLDEMDRTGVVVKDHVVYNTLVTSLAKAEQFDEVSKILKRMRSSRLEPDVKTYTAMLTGCKRSADWTRAEAILTDMRAAGIEPNSRTCHAMLKIYGDAGKADRAVALFQAWDEQGVAMDHFCFNAVIGAVLRNGWPRKALELFRLLESRGLEPDDAILGLALSAAEQAGEAELARRLVEGWRARGHVPGVQVYMWAIRACGTDSNATGRVSNPGRVDVGPPGTASGAHQPEGILASEGALQRARDIFNEAREHYSGPEGRRLYASFLMACARHGSKEGADAARGLLAEMRSCSVKLDHAALAAAASALAKGGAWGEAVQVLQRGAALGFSPDGNACEDVREGADAQGQLDRANELLAAARVASPLTALSLSRTR